ncbi:septin SPR3 NDAI_0D04160 [Naumovozyma dairenensis CBS 421]|uniref:Septin-type G domain-containing protein n=1 Tax=Naumovozyma dairenensis (strain ATCC 10597 / BCRC 20456 / CBS 421 / NBRC 0211 / NRRL Y-12639) TaxID=1071378 RepID=G0WAB9_NAUDC|nr:hypothetical protein NDAI_0D04160 [Naumovozyma dairenensis CBS 421]CCD24730.1 hypothetical protein NDAI_0D04160 [Naumovozyma dairenensis CBS 421]
MNTQSFVENDDTDCPQNFQDYLTGFFEMRKLRLLNAELNNPTSNQKQNKTKLLPTKKDYVYQKIMPGYHVGIDNIPKQLERITRNKGTNFNLLVAGQSGTGKTTLVNTLFGQTIINNQENESLTSCCGISKKKMIIEADDTQLNLTIIETPSYGNKTNNSMSWIPLVNYVDEQIRSYIFQEEQPYREHLQDNRIHCCLYLLEPNLRKLNKLDLITMKELSKRVNLIPVINKVDILNPNMLKDLKIQVKYTLDNRGVSICQFLTEFNNENGVEFDDIRTQYPFGVISSDKQILNNSGKLVLGRKYKWGIIEVDNSEFSDFLKLKQFLINDYMVDLVKSTESYYESCRSELLQTRILKARDYSNYNAEEYDKQASSPLTPISIPPDSLEELKELDYDDIENNKLKNYKCYEIFNKKLMDKIYIDWSPEFMERQFLFKKKFNEIINLEEKKFFKWAQALKKKQTVLNKEITTMAKQVEFLEGECRNLERMVLVDKKGGFYSNNSSTTLVGFHFKR